MRLSNKFTIAYAILTFIVLIVSFIISYQAFMHTSVQATVGKLSKLNDTINTQLQLNGVSSFDANIYYHTNAALLPLNEYLSTEVISAREFDVSLNSYINSIQVTSYYLYGTQTLKLTSLLKISYAEDEYLQAVIMIFIWTFVFLITLVVVVSATVSIYLLDPFYKTLNNLSLFKVDNEMELEFKDNSTYEFSQLNAFVKEMMQNAVSEYKALKEFNENASHELQTPLAVMRAKVDLLLQSHLESEQLKLLSEITDQIDRLSSIKKSLTLLVHLEHYVPTNTEVNVTSSLEHFFDELEDILSFREIDIVKDINADVYKVFDAQLLHILLNNLFSNALKYTEGDYIKVTLTNDYIELSNPGSAPTFDPNEYFKRFIKSSGKQFSSGIGLSIVKKITDFYNYEVKYQYENGIHSIKIIF